MVRFKKTVTYAKISPEMVSPRDIAGNAEEEEAKETEEEEEDDDDDDDEEVSAEREL